jgi:hypothetical protein
MLVSQRILTDKATIGVLSRGAGSGTFNNPTVTWSWTADPVPALFQQRSSAEQLDNRDEVTTSGVLLVPAGTTLSAESQVRLASLPGVTWQVMGDPNQLTAPGGRPTHIEALIQRISG